ncbi:MAG: DUF2333 family protein [Alphaproteobacteria bacterium]|nr:DUF2333 family protein [Alphaproteobacteria bacterium]
MKAKFLNFLKKTWTFLKNAGSFLKEKTQLTFEFVSTWWQGIVVFLLAVIFLYYPLGALLINNVDRNINYQFTTMDNPKQSKTIETMAHLIDREVNEKFWTPNLPFFFPSYFLDNMPNFQLGMFDALKNVSESFSKNFDTSSEMNEISELLAYPGTIWMFSPENKLKPVSSANSKYREARKKLLHFNNLLAGGEETLYRRPTDFAHILNKARLGLAKSVRDLEGYITEESNAWYNRKSDNLFYYNQGKAYGYYLLLNALGQDYKDIIIASNQYDNWTKMIKALENASQIDPLIVRNGKLSSSFAPNHLTYLSFYMLKAEDIMQTTIRKVRMGQ